MAIAKGRGQKVVEPLGLIGERWFGLFDELFEALFFSQGVREPRRGDAMLRLDQAEDRGTIGDKIGPGRN